jgi:hypothetical protein
MTWSADRRRKAVKAKKESFPMSQQVFDAFLASVFEVEWSILGLLLAAVLFCLAAVLLCTWVTHWRDKAVQYALNAEREQQRAVEVHAEMQKRDVLRRRLGALVDKKLDLYLVLRGTTTEAQVDFWTQCGEFGTPVPPLVLPEAHRPFAAELEGISRGLSYLESQLARVEHADLDFYQKWLEDLESRFLVFEIMNDQSGLQQTLDFLSEQHKRLGECHSSALRNPAYQLFPGMLHIVEMLVDDNIVPATHMQDYVTALWKQQRRLLKSLEMGTPVVWSDPQTPRSNSIRS